MRYLKPPSIVLSLENSAVLTLYIQLTKMHKIPHFEYSSKPSMLNLSGQSGGAIQQLATELNSEPHYDGQTIENMRGNPLYEKRANVDKVTLAQKKVIDAANAYSKSAMARQLNRQMSKTKIPKS